MYPTIWHACDGKCARIHSVLIGRRSKMRRACSAVALASLCILWSSGRILAGPPLCEPLSDGSNCRAVTCPTSGDRCQPRCMRYNPVSGATKIIDCDCRTAEACRAYPPAVTGNACVAPFNVDGTVHLPPAGCSYITEPSDPFRIVNGLPPGATIECGGTNTNFFCDPSIPVCSFSTISGCNQSGGSLGGEKNCSEATLFFDMDGTGALAGYSRFIPIPISFEIHTAPRTPFASVQEFDTDMFRLFGQITGDPDFDLLRITGGTDFGLPSPGHTTLTQLPGGNWAVDSFFDITYRIDFVGSPVGALAGMSGSTIGTVRMYMGSQPICQGICPPGFECRTNRVVNPDGTIDICCDCVELVCEPLPDLSACREFPCPDSSQICRPRCVRHFPDSGIVQVLDCDCRYAGECGVDIPPTVGNGCVVPDGGAGTVHLPPAGCAYVTDPSDPFQIVDGLPPATTIRADGENTNFVCNPAASVCSFPTAISCVMPGGTLGGEKSCYDATLFLDMNGTGTLLGFNRFIAVPIGFEIHAAPRTLFAPLQDFPTDMFRLFGQITGDPDFDLLRIVSGTDFGLPSPGHTTLTQLPGGNWAVDSFFDITYRIDFVGAPGGSLAGRSGSTTRTLRISTGAAPFCQGICPEGYICESQRVVNPDGSIDLCCDCRLFCLCRGDMNDDGLLTGADIQPFVDCYLNFFDGPIPPHCACADVSGDDMFSVADITLFVERLLAVPKINCFPM